MTIAACAFLAMALAWEPPVLALCPGSPPRSGMHRENNYRDAGIHHAGHAAFVPPSVPGGYHRKLGASHGILAQRGMPSCKADSHSSHNIQRRHPLHTLFSTSSDTITSKPPNDGNGAAAEKAQSLLDKARALRLEATAAEQKLRSVTQQKKDTAKAEADALIDVLLGATSTSVASDPTSIGGSGESAVDNVIPTAQTLALRIKEGNLISEKKLLSIVERLHERETAMMVGPEGYLSKQQTSIEKGSAAGGFLLGDYENNSLERKREESDRITGLLDRVLEAVQILDEEGSSGTEPSESGKLSVLASKLRVRVSDLRQNRDALLRRRVDYLASNSKSGSKKDDSIEGYVQMDDNNATKNSKSKEEKMMERLIETPPWLPPSLAAFAATSPVEVDISHWKMVKTDLLADSGFVCTSWDSTDVAAVYRGRLPRALATSRSPTESDEDGAQNTGDNSITAVFEDLQARLDKHVVLNGRIRLFLVDDYEWRPSLGTAGTYGTRLGDWSENEEMGPPPVIVALANEVEPEQESERSVATKSLAAFSTLLTTFTTFTYALSAFALNPVFFNAVVKENDVTPVPMCLPIFFGVLAISALHEAGHAVAAKKHKVMLGKPVPLPSLQVGTFGSITPLRTFPSSRAALFDVAVSGPGIAMLVSLALLVSGLKLTLGAQSLGNFPIVPAALMKASFLVGSIVSVIAPKTMLVPLSQPLPIHPFFLVGFAGIVMSAVNLLPIGRLDGGRAFMAAWGRRLASLVSFLSLLVLAFTSFSGSSGIIIFWGALVVLTQRLPDIPCVDEVTSVGDLRSNSYLLLLALSLLTLVPFPNGVGPI